MALTIHKEEQPALRFRQPNSRIEHCGKNFIERCSAVECLRHPEQNPEMLEVCGRTVTGFADLLKQARQYRLCQDERQAVCIRSAQTDLIARLEGMRDDALTVDERPVTAGGVLDEVFVSLMHDMGVAT